MKILHTADWHIGKKLHKQELAEDFELFTQWLCNCIREHEIEVLLVSGDVFDLANPSSEARRQYYKSLLILRELGCKIVLTGGNHDSPAMLDAPKHLLKELDLHVIGGLPQELEDTLIPIPDAHGNPQVIIAAIPYLRDADFKWTDVGSSHEERIANVRKGIEQIYHSVAQISQREYPGIPIIAMGHLFAAGMETSESERDIQLGNQAAFEAGHFGSHFNYIALGHIHKPQRVSFSTPTYYSGSPLPLSFSERKDQKRVLVIDTQDWEIQSIEVPAFRKLIRITGTLIELTNKLDSLPPPLTLESLLELELIEEQYDAHLLYLLDQLVSSFDKEGYRIVKHRAQFKNQLQGAAEAFSAEQQLEDLKPRDIFLKLIEGSEYDPELQKEILGAFDQLLEEYQSDQPSHTP